MRKEQFNKRTSLRFTQFSRQGYSLFAALGKEVLIGVLSVSTLTYAKADGISIRQDLAVDTLRNREVKLAEVLIEGSRAPLTLQQSARIVSIISRDDIQRAAVQTINDVLKFATSVDVRQRGGFGIQTDVSIDGGTHDQVTILLNGVSVCNPQTGHNAADFPVSLNDIERIEVLQGASARIFGVSAFSGAINIVTRGSTDGRRLRVDARAGSFGSVSAGAGYEAGRRGDYHLLTSGNYSRSDGGVPHSDFERSKLYANFRLQKNNLLRINAQLGGNLQRFGANTFYSVRFDNQFERTAHLLASASATLHDLLRGLDITATGSNNYFEDHFQLIRGKQGAANGENYHSLTVSTFSLNACMSWALGKTALGADYTGERLFSTAYGEDLSPDDYRDIPGSDRKYIRKGHRRNTNLFLEHNILLEHWTLSAGLLANRNTGLDSRFRFSPGVDVAFRPNSHWKFFVSWNKAMRIPTYTDLYTDNKAQKGDKNLKPESNASIRTGTRYRTDGLEASLNGFYSHGTDMIDWVYQHAASTRYQALNIGRLDNAGYSADLIFRFNELYGERCFVQQVRLGYAYIHQTHSTAQPIFKSLYALEYLRHKLTMTVDHRIWKRLAAHWALRWQQRMNGYDPYTKIDCKLQWTAPSYSLHLTVDNLTDHRYYDLGGVPQPGLWLMAGGTIARRL